MFDTIKQSGWQVVTLHHAEAILTHDMVTAATEIEAVLSAFTIQAEELVRGGGGESDMTQRLRAALTQLGWSKHTFEITKTVDGVKRESTSHIVDHVKKFGNFTFALEIEWNNKDPFYDRDLENFKRLHAEGAISVGGIITRGTTLHEETEEIIEAFAVKKNINSLGDLNNYYSPTSKQQTKINKAVRRLGSFQKGWANSFTSDKFGEATTHWGKLQDRIDRGVGNPCPLLLIGIPSRVVIP